MPFQVSRALKPPRVAAFCPPKLIQITSAAGAQVYLAVMARYDWTYALAHAATLIISVGAICILLFAL